MYYIFSKKNCLKILFLKVENLCSNIWFHGYLTMEESKKYLELEPLGTFIVRFSNSKLINIKFS